MQPRSLDKFDRQLLRLLQEDADVTADQLATQIGLSASAIQRRLQRLKAEKVITSIVALLDPQAIDRPTFFIVGLEIERERPELLSRLKTWLSDEDAVQQAFYVTGNWDYLLVVTASDVAAYDEFMARLLSENSNVRRFSTNVALSIQKRGLSIPVTGL